MPVAQVHLNQRYMTRALLNLLQNAIRYAGGNIRVSLVSPAPREYVLMVDDDGPGIPLADRERIFEPFIRLDESRDRGTGGTGPGAGDRQPRGALAQRHGRGGGQPAGRGPFHHQLEGSLSAATLPGRPLWTGIFNKLHKHPVQSLQTPYKAGKNGA